MSQRRELGLTLLEIMIAIAIGAMVLFAAATITGRGSRITADATESARVTTYETTFQRLITDDLRNAYAAPSRALTQAAPSGSGCIYLQSLDHYTSYCSLSSGLVRATTQRTGRTPPAIVQGKSLPSGTQIAPAGSTVSMSVSGRQFVVTLAIPPKDPTLPTRSYTIRVTSLVQP